MIQKFCTKEEKQNCYINTLGPIYPGETITINLRCNDNRNESRDILPVNVEMYHNYLPQSHCKVASTNETFKVVGKTCTLLYTLHFTGEKQKPVWNIFEL